MSSVVISGDTSGSVTLAAPAVAGTTTLTLPASTGTVMVNGPAFSAYQSVSVSLTTAVMTKITFTNTSFDTNSNYSTSTSRFTPTVAGYYQVNAAININFSTSALGYMTLYRNGSQTAIGPMLTGTAYGCQTTLSALVYMNGSTDYLEIYALQNSGSTQSTYVATSQDYFQAAMIRSA
jgi:hypothetical protein